MIAMMVIGDDYDKHKPHYKLQLSRAGAYGSVHTYALGGK